jgi:hypothetical protein
MKLVLRFLRWLIARIEAGPSDVINVRLDPLGDVCHETNHEWVSRHHLAEGDLICPRCRGVASARGDFSKARTYKFSNGKVNEGIRCGCMVKRNGLDGVCGTILYASPDTEHGDQLVVGDPPEFYVFRRVDPLTAAQEAVGLDVVQVDTDLGQVSVVRPEEEPLQPVHLPKE